MMLQNNNIFETIDFEPKPKETKKKKKPNKADLMVYEAFKTALDKKEINIYINDKVLNRPGMQVYNPWENLLPKLIPVTIGLLLLYVNVFLGLVIILGSIGIGERLFRKKNNHKLFERTKSYILESYENLEEMWNLGSIVMSIPGNTKKICLSPNDAWKEFIIKHFSKYMTTTKEKSEPKVETKKEEIKEEKESIIRPYNSKRLAK